MFSATSWSFKVYFASFLLAYVSLHFEHFVSVSDSVYGFCGRFGKKIYEIGKNEGYFGLGIGEKFGPTGKAENPLAFIPVHFPFSSSSI